MSAQISALEVLEILFDVTFKVRGDNPYDGRTRPGRAWNDAAQLVHEAVRVQIKQLAPRGEP